MTEEEKRTYARELILGHAQDVEWITIFEASYPDEISEGDAREVDDLIRRAVVEVSW